MISKRGFFLIASLLLISLGVLSFYLSPNFFERVFYQAERVVPSDPDSMGLAPGYPIHTMSVSQQFNHFPLPQFAPENKLLPNFLWMDPIYFGGNAQPGVTLSQAVDSSVVIQSELASNWNYYLMVSSNTKIFNKYDKAPSFQQAWISLANKHPEWPISAITFWAQTIPSNLNDPRCQSKRAFITRKDLPDSCYLPFHATDKPSKKILSPALPREFYECDIEAQRMYVQELLKHLTRPLDCINENGEVFPLIPEAMLRQDDRVLKDKERYPAMNWYEYQSQKRLELEREYRNRFMQDPRLKNCRYSVYALDGMSKFRQDWSIMRKVQTMNRGMHYSTPDFYPRWPSNWRKWKGPWHGLAWIEECRNTETQLGDHLFSPFVAAGWDKDETVNIPPGQWLGLLKILLGFGAEYYYTGYFNEKMPPNDPRQYCWQAVMPAYAQASVSWYADQQLLSHTLRTPDWFLPSNTNGVMAIARKMTNQEKYLLFVSYQLETNDSKNPRSAQAMVKLAGKEILLDARIQGSVYFIDLTQPENPLVIQTDEWHEPYHPARWCSHPWMSAALQPGKNPLISRFTKTKNQWNFKGLKTGVKLKDKAQYEFYFQTRLDSVAEIILETNCPKGDVKAVLTDPSGNEQNIILRSGQHTFRIHCSVGNRPGQKCKLLITSGEMELFRWKTKRTEK